MAILRYLPMLSCSLLLCSCYEDFTPDMEITPVLCLNSLITAGEKIEVEVSRTRLYTDMLNVSSDQVDDAEVRIYANGSEVGDDYEAKEGDCIKIKAYSPTYGNAEAEVIVPVAPVISLGEYDPRVNSVWHTDWSQVGWHKGTIIFNMITDLIVCDRPYEDNYYYFGYTPFDSSDTRYDSLGDISLFPGDLDEDFEPIFSEHMGVMETMMGDGIDGWTYFSDGQFKSGSYKLRLRFTDGIINYDLFEPTEYSFYCGYRFKVSSVSDSYYYWLNYLWYTEKGSMIDLSEIGLAEPIWGYSNVSTGAGIVAAQAYNEVELNLGNFVVEAVEWRKITGHN